MEFPEFVSVGSGPGRASVSAATLELQGCLGANSGIRGEGMMLVRGLPSCYLIPRTKEPALGLSSYCMALLPFPTGAS